jgi:hypothetical protein
MIFTVLTKLPLMSKLKQNDVLLENAMKKLRLWLNFSAAQQCNGMNDVVTSHLPIYLYSVAGVKVNRQVACTRCTVTCTH